jgi:hypothetical protein
MLRISGEVNRRMRASRAWPLVEHGSVRALGDGARGSAAPPRCRRDVIDG